jgi:hypothetical protein
LKTLLESDEFRTELPGWALRGVLCAANSACWAWMMGFQQAVEIAGMVAGVACWVALFAAACVLVPRLAWWKQFQVAVVLRQAAWIKIGLTAAGWLIFALASATGLAEIQQLAMLGMIDMLLGIAALSLVALLGGMSGPEQVAAADSFLWTLATTVTEGALVAGVIVGIAVAVLIARKCWDVVRRHADLPPVRF